MCTLQTRYKHSASAFVADSGQAEIIVFGECPKCPENFKSDADLTVVADTTVLRFGKCDTLITWTACMHAFNYLHA